MTSHPSFPPSTKILPSLLPKIIAPNEHPHSLLLLHPHWVPGTNPSANLQSFQLILGCFAVLWGISASVDISVSDPFMRLIHDSFGRCHLLPAATMTSTVCD